MNRRLFQVTFTLKENNLQQVVAARNQEEVLAFVEQMMRANPDGHLRIGGVSISIPSIQYIKVHALRESLMQH
ncbi:hypothetical protein [Ectobacillus ponti]|uniref:Uncharacterized protein n=1 Tax=Ectobacillus ponti TaxID=2961894 RepID=A0AA42BRX7_9BACI|nr:hypothetical protein [Ectobacillus ponti]MCP8967828.1 hypothetical protein [Ectobacillus ponti]